MKKKSVNNNEEWYDRPNDQIEKYFLTKNSAVDLINEFPDPIEPPRDLQEKCNMRYRLSKPIPGNINVGGMIIDKIEGVDLSVKGENNNYNNNQGGFQNAGNDEEADENCNGY